MKIIGRRYGGDPRRGYSGDSFKGYLRDIINITGIDQKR
jgi:hypothetical protein